VRNFNPIHPVSASQERPYRYQGMPLEELGYAKRKRITALDRDDLSKKLDEGVAAVIVRNRRTSSRLLGAVG